MENLNIEQQVEKLKSELDDAIVNDKGFIVVFGVQEGEGLGIGVMAQHVSKEGVVEALKNVIDSLLATEE